MKEGEIVGMYSKHEIYEEVIQNLSCKIWKGT
jgi:hypothetical protein